MERQLRKWTDLNRNAIRLLTLFGLFLTFFLAIYLYRAGYDEVLAHIHQLLIRIGVWGPCFFIVLQLTQVVYPIIPGGLTLVVGHLVFGPYLGFLYSLVGVTGGSILNFFLARKYGKTFVRAFVAEETYQKYHGWLTKGKRFEGFMATSFALPGFPDDFLCMAAGLTDMTFKRFMTIYLIFKPFTLYLYGSGGAFITNWIVQYFGRLG